VPYQKDEIDHMRLRIKEMSLISSELEKALLGGNSILMVIWLGIGEVIAAYHYNLELLPSSAERHDATQMAEWCR